MANRRSGDLTIRPVVLSPGTTDGTRRLGDLRLQCEVGWAIERHDASLLVRGAYGLAGGACRSSMIAIGFTAPKKLRDVELSLGERSAKARLASTGVTYWPPLHDKSWPDETVVVLKPDNQNRAIALPGPDSQASASRAGG